MGGDSLYNTPSGERAGVRPALPGRQGGTFNVSLPGSRIRAFAGLPTRQLTSSPLRKVGAAGGQLNRSSSRDGLFLAYFPRYRLPATWLRDCAGLDNEE